jgi:signal transduction histidine kinase
VARTGETQLVNDTSVDPNYYFEDHWASIRSELSVPIKQADSVVGILDLQSNRLGAFDDADVATIETLANQLAVAMENARLFDESRDLAVLEERNRMAREIHDTLSQGFTGIVLQMEASEDVLQDDPTEVQQHLTIAKNLARHGLAEARRSVWNLLPQALEENPLHVALSDEVERFNAVEAQQATFNISGARRQVPAVIQAALLRICQESLTNIRKYAEATQVSVQLTFGGDSVGISVVDNGTGFDPDNVNIGDGQGGFGLTAMRQRARLLRGNIEIISAPGRGTRVEATIPIG